MNNISIIHSRAEEYEDQIIQLWKECLPGTPEERFKWLAQGNPAGSAEWFLAIHEKNGRVVGTSSVMPKELFGSGLKIRGGIVGDIMVTPDFQGKGIARKIQKMIVASLPGLGMEFFYVVPNINSKRLFSLNGTIQKFRLKNYLLPVDTGYYFERMKWSAPMKWADRSLNSLLNKMYRVPAYDGFCAFSVESHFDKDFDLFWGSLQKLPELLIGSKSVSYLNWKYMTHQGGRFRVLKYRLTTGTLAGFCVFTVSESKIHIYELVCARNEYYVDLISGVRSLAKKEQCVGIYYYTLSRNPILKQLWWRGLCRIGGDMTILCSGKIFEKGIPWVFFAGDRNLSQE